MQSLVMSCKVDQSVSACALLPQASQRSCLFSGLICICICSLKVVVVLSQLGRHSTCDSQTETDSDTDMTDYTRQTDRQTPELHAV